MFVNSKFQVPNSRETQTIKAKIIKGTKKPDLFCLYWEFDYFLEFGFWNLEFI